MTQHGHFSFPVRAAVLCCGLAGLALAPAALGQDQPQTSSGALVADMKACRALTDANQRLACYDAAVGAMVAASDSGEVRIVDKTEITETKRKLFGFSVPNIGIFGGDGDDPDALFETTITGARMLGRDSWQFTTAEGAVWEINNPQRRIRPIEAGNTVVFKKAALGSYFIRIDGQIGVKGRRVK